MPGATATWTTTMSDTVFRRLERLLKQHRVDFEVLRHEPVYTSQQAAEVRGTRLASGAKALICRGDAKLVMFVMPADRKLASRRVRAARAWRKLRFATSDELLELTGLTSGAIPPFGSLFGLPTCCDVHLADSQRINFNAGDHCISVAMSYADYLRVERPELGTFAE
jgi:Ala-tRNA(Pro) deacylase